MTFATFLCPCANAMQFTSLLCSCLSRNVVGVVLLSDVGCIDSAAMDRSVWTFPG